MGSAAALTSLTFIGPDSPPDEIVAADGEELRALHRLLAGQASQSALAKHLADAIERALAEDSELVLITGAPGPPDDRRAAMRRRLTALIEQMMPELATLSSASAVLSQRNALRRGELLDEFGAWTAGEIGEQFSNARNRHALAGRWRKEGRIFAVAHKGQMLFPAFQFDVDSRKPRPLIAEALRRLPVAEMGDWELALWWTAGNGWLQGRRPVDLIDDDSDAVLQAAEHLAAPTPL